MILKTAANYNDEGGYIEAWKNSDGTTEVKLIPKSGDEGKQGLKSITISPEITTTPALDSLFPIYYDDVTEEQKEDGVRLFVTVPDGAISEGEDVQITYTPTPTWYVADEEMHFGGQGEPMTVTRSVENGEVDVSLFLVETDTPGADFQFFAVELNITVDNK